MLYLTKEYKFCAAHRYWNDKWSDKKNEKVFGEDVKIHGHNYYLAITVKGTINNDSGFNQKVNFSLQLGYATATAPLGPDSHG